MKLRNKLIPLMSVVTATGVVAPIATSCGARSMEMVDIVNGYVPTIEKAKTQPEGLTDEEVNDLYFEHLAANPDILKQDILKYQADLLPIRIWEIEHPDYNEQEYICKNVVANIGVSNVSVRRVDAVIEQEETHFYTIDCKVSYEFAYKALSMDGKYEHAENIKFAFEMHDIPVIVYQNDVYNPGSKNSGKMWWVSNNLNYSDVTKAKLDAIPGWYYSFNESYQSFDTTVDSEGRKTTTSSDYSRGGKLNTIDQIWTAMGPKVVHIGGSADYVDEYIYCPSYHLSDVGFSYGDAFKFSIAADANNTLQWKWNIKDKGFVSTTPILTMSETSLSALEALNDKFVFYFDIPSNDCIYFDENNNRYQMFQNVSDKETYIQTYAAHVDYFGLKPDYSGGAFGDGFSVDYFKKYNNSLNFDSWCGWIRLDKTGSPSVGDKLNWNVAFPMGTTISVALYSDCLASGRYNGFNHDKALYTLTVASPIGATVTAIEE